MLLVSATIDSLVVSSMRGAGRFRRHFLTEIFHVPVLTESASTPADLHEMISNDTSEIEGKVSWPGRDDNLTPPFRGDNL